MGPHLRDRARVYRTPHRQEHAPPHVPAEVSRCAELVRRRERRAPERSRSVGRRKACFPDSTPGPCRPGPEPAAAYFSSMSTLSIRLLNVKAIQLSEMTGGRAPRATLRTIGGPSPTCRGRSARR
jgi:hypothetical protein